MDLRGQCAIVTGGARGIGAAICRALAREGANIVVADLLDTEQTEREVAAAGAQAIGVRVDVTDAAQVAAMVEAALSAFGRVDILVNNAGVASRTGVERTTEALWDRDCDVIMKGGFLCIQAVYPIMKRQGGGKIVNMSSLSGKVGGVVSKGGEQDEDGGGRSGPAYAAAKGGVIALTKWVAKDGGHFGVYCNAVCPGGIDTDMTRGFEYDVASLPIPRMGQPEDVAEAVLFLASNASNYITGQALNVDGGLGSY
jgi:3-oxoacyl-[acyl-carrier protein] reductase